MSIDMLPAWETESAVAAGTSAIGGGVEPPQATAPSPRMTPATAAVSGRVTVALLTVMSPLVARPCVSMSRAASVEGGDGDRARGHHLAGPLVPALWARAHSTLSGPPGLRCRPDATVLAGGSRGSGRAPGAARRRGRRARCGRPLARARAVGAGRRLLHRPPDGHDRRGERG